MVIIEGSIGALAIFMIINSITPGPNNLMLLQGGLKRGYWGCRWHMLGITFGVGVMLWLSYWGMSALIVEIPVLMFVIKILGTVYLLWLTYVMATSDFRETINKALTNNALVATPPIHITSQQLPSQPKRFGELPLTFRQAAIFQWLNPKAWTMTMVAPSIAIISSTRPWLDNVPLVLISMCINITCISFWSAGGQWLRLLVHRPLMMRLIHAVIVMMTLYCAVALWL